LGAACRNRCAGEVGRRRLSACVLDLAFGDGLDGGIWGVGDQVLRRKIWLVPLRDAVHFVIWLASFGSNHVRWGNVEYVIRQGRMVPQAGGQRAVAKPAEHAPRS